MRKRRRKRTPIEERFWPKVDKTDDCWLWTAATNRHGYGQIWSGEKLELAHRVSWELHRGPIPAGLFVLHIPSLCHTPGCVNPDHLYLGTHTDNEHDKFKDGTSNNGEANGQAKLQKDDVLSIRERYAAGNVTQKELSKEYGVARRTIGMITTRRTWRHMA